MRRLQIASRYITFLCLIGALVLFNPQNLWATESVAQAETILTDSIDTVSEAASSTSAWQNFFPPPDSKYDWIQLTSDEWLKGRLRFLYRFKLEFDSDELGLLSLDWDDIKQVRTAGPQAVRLEDPANGYIPITIFGVLTIVDGTASIETSEGARQFDRNTIISIATGTRREADFWSGKVSLGANIRSGNSDLVDATLAAKVKRRRAESRVVLDYLGNYSRARSTTTSNNHRLSGHYDMFKTTRWFWRPVGGEYFRDPFKNIQHQATLGTGAGYHIIQSSKTEWDISGGVGVLYKRYVSVIPGQNIDNVSPTLGFGTRYDTEVTSWLDYLFDFSFQFVDEESGTYLHHLITTLSSDIIGDIDLDVSLVWDRVEDPEPTADGTVPEKNDFQLIVAIGYEF